MIAMSFRLLESQRPSWTSNTSQLCNSAQLILLFFLAYRLLFLFNILLKPLSILLYLTRPRQFHPILISYTLIYNVRTSSLIFLTRHVLDLLELLNWFILHSNVTADPHSSGLVLYTALRINTSICQTLHLLSLLHDIPELLRLEHLHKVFIAKMLVLFVFDSIKVGVLFFLIGSEQMPRIENDLRSISSYLLNTVDGFFYLALNMNGFSQ